MSAVEMVLVWLQTPALVLQDTQVVNVRISTADASARHLLILAFVVDMEHVQLMMSAPANQDIMELNVMISIVLVCCTMILLSVLETDNV